MISTRMPTMIPLDIAPECMPMQFLLQDFSTSFSRNYWKDFSRNQSKGSFGYFSRGPLKCNSSWSLFTVSCRKSSRDFRGSSFGDFFRDFLLEFLQLIWFSHENHSEILVGLPSEFFTGIPYCNSPGTPSRIPADFYQKFFGKILKTCFYNLVSFYF